MPPQNLSSSTLHTSVMLQESVDSIFEDDGSLLSTGRIYVDATAGLGGHSEYILSKLATNDRLIMIDRDPENLDLASARLSDSRVTPVCASFGDIASILGQLEIPSIDGIIYDLGVSSVHYDDPERGFSIRENGPLDMRFNRRSSELVPASEWLMRVGERDLFIGMRDYADEPKAYFVAKAIVAARTLKAITTTGELKAIIEAASFDPKSALRCFQAIRIMVNNEFGEIQKSIPAAVQALRSWGRMSVITFHSIEDRLIKNIAHSLETPHIDEVTGRIITPWSLKKITKKPLQASAAEVAINSRSRSAKLRVYKKI